MIQSELFISAAIAHKEKALRQLDEFDFAAALDSLTIAKEIDPYLADLDFLIALGEYARQNGAKPQSSSARLTTLWHQARQSYEDGDLPQAAYQYLLQLIARRLLRMGKFTSAGFCGEREKFLHRGVLHAVLKEWQAAHHELLNLVTAAGGEALAVHWGYLGDAAYALRRWKDANLAYVCALFRDPNAIDVHTLQHPELRALLEALIHQTHDQYLARAWWPIHAWMSDIVQVPTGHTFLLPLVRELRSILGSKLMLEPVQRLRQFALCLYIDQAGVHGEIQFDVREEMKNLEAGLFARYLQEIEKRAKRRL